MAKNQSILLMILDKFLNLEGTSIQGYRHLEPTFRTLSVTTSQKRKMPESKYLSRGVSWRQAAGN
jgi:hypothetical protein